MSLPTSQVAEPVTNLDTELSDQQELVRFHRRLNLIAAGVIVLVGLVYLFRLFDTVMQNLLVALFLLYMIMPVHRWLMRHGVAPIVSCIVIVTSIVVGFAGLGLLIGTSFRDLEKKLPTYQESLTRLIDETAQRFPAVQKVRESMGGSEREGLERGRLMAQSALQGLSDFLSQAFVVLIYFLFMLAERASLPRRLEHAFAEKRAKQVEEVVDTINYAITQYIVVKTLMGVLAGIVTVVVLSVFGVDYAALWGILAFLFNYIPYLGSILATAAPVLLSLVQFGDPWLTLWILTMLFALQIAIGYVVEPRLAGRRLDMSPFVIIVALAFWGSLWGIIGMILAVPLMVVIKTVLEHTKATRPLARLLANA